MRRFASVLLGALAWPALAAAARAAPLDNAIQSLSDVAFVSGHAPSAGGVIVARAGDPAHPVLAPPVSRPAMPDMALASGQGGSPSAGDGLRLGGEVKVGSVGALVQRELRALGVKDGAARYGGAGRFYLFAAVHGQAVGLNLQQQGGALRRTGWSTDISSALVGDGQIGLGWRKGGIEADFGYVHRGVHLKGVPLGVSDSYADDMAALSFTFHPRW